MNFRVLEGPPGVPKKFGWVGSAGNPRGGLKINPIVDTPVIDNSNKEEPTTRGRRGGEGEEAELHLHKCLQAFAQAGLQQREAER